MLCTLYCIGILMWTYSMWSRGDSRKTLSAPKGEIRLDFYIQRENGNIKQHSVTIDAIQNAHQIWWRLSLNQQRYIFWEIRRGLSVSDMTALVMWHANWTNKGGLIPIWTLIHIRLLLFLNDISFQILGGKPEKQLVPWRHEMSSYDTHVMSAVWPRFGSEGTFNQSNGAMNDNDNTSLNWHTLQVETTYTVKCSNLHRKSYQLRLSVPSYSVYIVTTVYYCRTVLWLWAQQDLLPSLDSLQAITELVSSEKLPCCALQVLPKCLSLSSKVVLAMKWIILLTFMWQMWRYKIVCVHHLSSVLLQSLWIHCYLSQVWDTRTPLVVCCVLIYVFSSYCKVSAHWGPAAAKLLHVKTWDHLTVIHAFLEVMIIVCGRSEHRNVVDCWYP